jgi:predicted ribosomally synthesized peptide with nif11-like leader
MSTINYGGKAMSLQAARNYVGRMRTDVKFKSNVLALKDPKARMSFVNAEGFDFSHSECDQVKNEMSDEELDMVSAIGLCCYRCEREECEGCD